MMVKKFEYFHGRKLSAVSGNVDKLPRINMFLARGSRWKRLRTISNPSFTVNNLKKVCALRLFCFRQRLSPVSHDVRSFENVTFQMIPIVDDSCKALITHLDKKFRSGDAFNFHPFCFEFSCDVICRVALGQKESKLFDNPVLGWTKNALSKFWNDIFDKPANMFPVLSSLFERIYFYCSLFKFFPFKKLFNELGRKVEERKKQRVSFKK